MNVAVSSFSLHTRLHLHSGNLMFHADSVSALLCGRGDGSAGAAREEAGGVSGPGSFRLRAAQVPDPEPAVCSTGGRVAHRPRTRPRLSGPVSGAAIAQRHQGRPQPLLC